MRALQQEAEHTDPIPLGTEAPKIRTDSASRAPQQQLLMLLSCPSVQTLHQRTAAPNPITPAILGVPPQI